MICMFGDLSPFRFDSVIPSFLCSWSWRGQACKQPTFPYPELSCPGRVPEKLPTGNCSGILGWSQQETNLFLFWAKFSLYDSPSVLFWLCRSCAGMSNIPARAQGTERAGGAPLVPDLFWHWQGRLQSSLGWIFICNNCFTYRTERSAYYWLC